MEHLISLTKENIQQVVDTSMEKMVVLTFFAKQHPQSMQMLQVLSDIATKQAGRFILASVDCETEVEIAQYFQIQSLPTTLILDKGRPVDGFAGEKSAAEVNQLLDTHLPALWQQEFDAIKLELAQQENMPTEELTSFVTELKSIAIQATEANAKNVADIQLVLIDVHLQLGQLAEAKALLGEIKLADQDSYYQNLKAKLALAEDAADTPEIRELQTKLDVEPDNLAILCELAKALNKAGRNDEALALLFTPLQKDLSAGDGKVKQLLLEIMTAMGQGNPVANQYRRKLYTLLY